MQRLIPRSKLTGKKSTIDSVKERKAREGEKTNLPLLRRFEESWDAWEPIRATRLRNLRYVTIDQWSDMVVDEEGNLVRERDRIAKRTGGVVLQNNYLSKIVETVVSIYAQSRTKPVCYARKDDADQKSKMMTGALQTNWDTNQMHDMLTTEMYEFVLGGVPVVEESWRPINGQEDSYTLHVDVNHFTAETEANDPRHWDVSMCGCFRDYTIGELASRVCHNDYDYQQLEAIYAPYLSDYYSHGYRDYEDRNQSFLWPEQNNLCRAFEIWTKEHKPRYRCVDRMDYERPIYKIEKEELPMVRQNNIARIQMALEQGMIDAPTAEALTEAVRREKAIPEDCEVPLIETEYIIDEYWHYQMLAPDGHVLDEYDSPFEHGGHPYTFKMHLLLNGRVTPFISPYIDRQRYVNRLISLDDMLINSSIKGLKMIPKQAVPDDMDPEEFAEHAMEIGGWIFYDAEKLNKYPNARLDVITNNATNIGIGDLLQIELNYLNDGIVSQALQGKQAASGTAASRYAMESQNSAASMSALITKFNTFENEIAKKKMKTIQQYYEEGRLISSSNSNGYNEYSHYSPKEVADIDFDCAIKDSFDSPVSRMMNNETLEAWAAAGWLGQNPIEDLLTYGYYPALENLKQKVSANQEAMQQTGQMSQLQGAGTGAAKPMPNTTGQVAGSNANTVRQIQDALRAV